MTDDVAALVLRDNYFQTQALSVGRPARRAAARPAGALHPLPGEERAAQPRDRVPADRRRDRRAQGARHRPDDPRARGAAGLQQDVAVRRAASTSDLPEDPWVGTALAALLPGAAAREVRRLHPAPSAASARSSPRTCSTAWSTASARPSCTGWPSMTGAKPAQVVRAYLATREVFGHVALWQQIEALDNKVPDAVQSEMLIEEGWLTARATTWFLRSRRLAEPMEQTVQALHAGGAGAARAARARGRGVAAGAALGRRPACRRRWRSASPAPTACSPRSTSPRSPRRPSAARRGEPRCTSASARASGLAQLRQQIDALPADSYWQSLAKARARRRPGRTCSARSRRTC